MKRIIFLAILIGAFSLQSYSQLQFGAKAGLMTASSNLDKNITDLPTNTDYGELEMEAKNAKAGFQAGFFGRLTVLGVYVQPELMFSSTNSRIQVKKLSNDEVIEKQTKTQSFKKIDIPLLIGGKFGPLRIQAGPVGSFMLDEKSAIEAAIDETEVKEKFNSATWGYQVGVGADFFNFLTLDLKYEGNLSALGDNVKIAGEPYPLDSRTSQFIFTAGIFF
jgi:hypothetical protein